MLAATWPRIVRLLLEFGVDVNVIDQEKHSAIASAILWKTSHDSERLLEAMRSLIDAKANVNCRDQEGKTPLAHARSMFTRASLEVEIVSTLHLDNPIFERSMSREV